MRAQVAVEYLIIVGVALMILLPLSLYLNQTLMGYRDDTKISKAWNTVKKLGQNADWVHSQGPPARVRVEIDVPEDVTEMSLDNNMILYRIRTSAGISDVFYNTVPALNGTLPTNSQYYFISITAINQTHVDFKVV